MTRLDGAALLRLLSRRETVVAAALLFAATLLASGTPIVREVPHRDSGVFLYVAERILDGDLPYRDVWDHKPPGVYYLNAVGLLLPVPGAWGVWLLSVAAVGGALALGWWVLSRAFGAVPALVATAVWPLLAATDDVVNFIETYALPLQFAILALFWRGQRSGSHRASDLAIGALAAGLLLLRPNLIGVPLAVGVVVLIEHRHRALWPELARRLSRFVLGALAVVAPVVLYFGVVGALGDFVDQAFVYNLQYSSGSGLAPKVLAAANGWVRLADAGASPILVGGAAWLVVIYELRRPGLLPTRSRPLLAVAAAGLPIEVALSSISGETYLHYYVAWLPILAVLVAYAVARLWSSLRRLDDNARLSPVWTGALAAAFAVSVLGLVANTARDLRDDPQRSETLSYIQRETSSSQGVLMWGAEVSLNWASGRAAPVRYVYQYPLTTPGYATSAMSAEFLADLEREPPVLVIDAVVEREQPRSVRPIPSLAVGDDEDSHPLEGVDSIVAFLREHYEPVEVVGPREWVVYRLRGNVAP